MTLLVAWLWQGLLLVAILQLVLRALPRVNAATRHLAWWIALLTILLLPVFTGLGSGYPADAVPTISSAAPEAASAWTDSAGLFALPPLPDWAVAVLLGAWAGSAVLALARLGAGVAAIRRLKASSRPMPDALQVRLASWTGCRERGRRVELRLSDDHSGACALGLGSPVVLVSAALAEVLDAEELDAIVMHEYAHLARRDDWTGFVQCLVQCLVGPHPAVSIVARRIDLEREASCDDWVVTHATSPEGYVACLVELAALMTTRSAASHALMPGATGSRGTLRARVVRLLDPNLDRSRCISRPLLALAAASAAGVIGLGIAVHPIVAFEQPAGIHRVDAARKVAAPVAEPAVSSRIPHEQSGPRLAIPPVTESSPRRRLDRRSLPQRHVVWIPSVRSAAVGTALHEDHPALTATPLEGALHAAPDVASRVVTVTPAVTGPGDAPWARTAAAGTALGTGVARGGTAIGRGARTAGTSVAGFFGRAGKAVADSF